MRDMETGLESKGVKLGTQMGSSCKYRGGEKETNSDHILEVESVEFCNSLHVKAEERSIKNNSQVSGRSNCLGGFYLNWEETDLRRKAKRPGGDINRLLAHDPGN